MVYVTVIGVCGNGLATTENRLVRAQELYAPTNRTPYTVTYAYDHKGRMARKETLNEQHAQ